MNWNFFKRIDKIELDNLHLNVLLKGARADIEILKKIVIKQTQCLQSLATPKPKAVPKAVPKAAPTKRQMKTTEKQREYSRRYYAKKKAAAKVAA